MAIEGSRAALWSLTWFLGLGSLAVLIEALVYLPPYWRLLPPGLAVTGAIVAARTVLRQGLGGVSDAHSMALFVERRVPVLGERLITAFELADDANCSTTLLAATREEALAALQQTDVSQISSLRRSRAALGAVAAGLALMLLIGTAFAEQIADVEHRWLHHIEDSVPEEMYFSELDKAQILRQGSDVTIVANSLMTIETMKAAAVLSEIGVNVEVVDLRSIKPIDLDTILKSVSKTKKMIVVDSAWKTGGISGEVVSLVVEHGLDLLECAPLRVTSPDHPVPTSHYLADEYYKDARQISLSVLDFLNMQDKAKSISNKFTSTDPIDVPNRDFHGPF